MGKWADRLATLDAEVSRTPPHGLTDKTAKTPVPSVLAVPSRGDDKDFSNPAADHCCWPRSDAWSGAEIARFQARADRLAGRGFSDADAEHLAERLVLRDRNADDRVVCAADCRNLAGSVAAGWRCQNHEAADVARELPADLVTLFQRCQGFAPVAGEADR